MNLAKIKSGDVVANYPKMCELLEEPKKRGNPRERQIEDWKRYLNYEKQGHKFLIVEIYTAPVPKVDGRSQGNHSVYVQPASCLLLDEIANLAPQASNEDKDFVELTNKNIKLLVGLCNQEYLDEDEKMFNEMIVNRDITLFDKQDFYKRTNSKQKEIIDSIFKNLLKNNKCTEIINCYYIFQDGKSRLSTNYEENLIDEASTLVLVEFGENNISSIYLKNKQKVFYKRVNALLYELYNWEISYKTNLLFFNTDMLIDDSIYKLTEDERIEFKAIVNNSIKDFLDVQANKHFIKNQTKNKIGMEEHIAKHSPPSINKKMDSTPNKTGFYFKYPIYEGFVLHKYYEENQKILSDLLIKLDD